MASATTHGSGRSEHREKQYDIGSAIAPISVVTVSPPPRQCVTQHGAHVEPSAKQTFLALCFGTSNGWADAMGRYCITRNLVSLAITSAHAEPLIEHRCARVSYAHEETHDYFKY